MPDNGIPTSDSSYASATSTAFDADFNRLVGPGLLNLVLHYAYQVQTGLAGFSEAANCVLENALKLGADRLSPQAFSEMVEWIDLEILARLDDPPAEGVLTPHQLEALIRLEV